MNTEYQRTREPQTTTLGVPDAFYAEFPNIKRDKASKYFEQYLQAIRSVLIKQSIFSRSAVFSVSLSDLYHKCSSFNYEKKRISIWKTFHRLCPILTVINKGNNMTHMLSEVRITAQYMDMLINTASGLDIIKVWFGHLDLESIPMHDIPIDMVGLRHYIASTQKELLTATNDQHIETLEYNLSRARQVEVVSTYMKNLTGSEVHCWPHAENPSPYGRTYYYGMNLQNCSRVLRHAVLGRHHQYDIVAAVYAIKLMIAEEVAAERNESLYGRFVNTKEYLDYKNPIRNRLAGHITAYPQPLKLVKEALTALGFGARLQSSSWVDSEYVRQYGALSSIIKHKADCRNFIHDPWVIQFVREQKELTDYIVSHWLDNADFCDRIRDIPGMLTPTGKFKRNQVMCYLFQHMESQIMNTVIEQLNIPVVVRIHDAFVTKQRIDMVQLRRTLAAISPYLNVEHEAWDEFRMDDYSGEVAEHYALLEQQQHAARRWALSTGRPISDHNTSKRLPYIKPKTEYYDGCYYEQESVEE